MLRQTFFRAHIPQRCWFRQGPFWSPPSNLLAPGAYSPTSWLAPVPGPPKPSSQPVGIQHPPPPPAGPGPGPSHQQIRTNPRTHWAPEPVIPGASPVYQRASANTGTPRPSCQPCRSSAPPNQQLHLRQGPAAKEKLRKQSHL